MAHYARLDRAAIDGLARRFGIDDVAAFSVMHGGSDNTNYLIKTNSGKYVLTLCEQKSLERTIDLVNLLVHLANHGIRTSRVVVPLEESVVILHDQRPVMLKHHIDGDTTGDLSGIALFQLGEEMARLHAIPVPSYVPDSFPYGRSYFHEVIDSNLDHAFVGWLSEKNSYLQKQIPQTLPKALIHGDIFVDNLVVQGNQLVAIIDFEDACHYYRCFDLGMTIVGTCRDHQGICFEKAKRFIHGYQNQASLQPDEREALKIYVVYAAVITSFWRFRHYHLRKPERQFHDKHIEMQTLADTIAEYPASRFTGLFG